MSRVLLDCDGVLGDFPSEVVRFCNTYGGCSATLDDVSQHDILKALGVEHLQQRLDIHMADSDFCRHIPVYPGAKEFVDELKRRRHEIVIVTSPYSAVENWCSARVAWLQREFGIDRRDVIFAKRKELIRGDVLVDDQADNCEAFRKAGNLSLGFFDSFLIPSPMAICFDRPWNRSFNGWRAHSYEQVLELIR